MGISEPPLTPASGDPVASLVSPAVTHVHPHKHGPSLLSSTLIKHHGQGNLRESLLADMPQPQPMWNDAKAETQGKNRSHGRILLTSLLL